MLRRWKEFRDAPKGEVTLVLGPGAASSGAEGDAEALEAVGELVRAGLPRRRAAEIVAGLTGLSRNSLYRRSL